MTTWRVAMLAAMVNFSHNRAASTEARKRLVELVTGNGILNIKLHFSAFSLWTRDDSALSCRSLKCSMGSGSKWMSIAVNLQYTKLHPTAASSGEREMRTEWKFYFQILKGFWHMADWTCSRSSALRARNMQFTDFFILQVCNSNRQLSGNTFTRHNLQCCWKVTVKRACVKCNVFAGKLFPGDFDLFVTVKWNRSTFEGEWKHFLVQ